RTWARAAFSDEQEELQPMRERLRAPEGWPDLSIASEERGLGWSIATGIYGERGERLVLMRIARGWPARSMANYGVFHERERASRDAWSIAPPRSLLPTGDWFPVPRHRLPLMPIPAGFAINTMFYAALLALPLTFFPIRRRLRARRGRCPTCGYDRAGLESADPATPCPECGSTFASPSRSP